MRVHFRDTFHPLRVSKSLKRLLDEAGHPTKLSAAQALVARMLGYADWHELHMSAAAQPPSPWDGDAAPDVVAGRRRQYVETLVLSGIPRETAERIIDDVRPTDVRKKGGEPRWPLLPQVADRLGLSSWLGRIDTLPTLAGYRRLHEDTMAAIADDRHWAALWARRHDLPELIPALEALKANPEHPLWPPLMLMTMAHTMRFLEHVGISGIDISSAVRLDRCLKSASDGTISSLSHLLLQHVPGTLGNAAFEAPNDFLSVSKAPVRHGSFSAVPWKKRGPVRLPRPFGPRWDDMTMDDVRTFSTRFDASFDDPYGFSFKSVDRRDPDFVRLRMSEGATFFDNSIPFGEERQSDEAIARDEIIVFARHPPKGKRELLGYIALRNEMRFGERLEHNIRIHHMFTVDGTLDEDAAGASLTAVTYPFNEALDKEWSKIAAPGQRLDVRVLTEYFVRADPYWLLELTTQLKACADLDADMNEIGSHFLDVHVTRREAARSSQRVPRLGKLVVKPRQTENLSRLRRHLDDIANWSEQQPLGIYVTGDDREVVLAAGWPGDEVVITPSSVSEVEGEDRWPGRDKVAKAVSDITEGDLSAFIRKLVPMDRDVVLVPVDWVTLAVFDVEAWRTGEWYEEDLGISLVYQSQPKADERESSEEWFWLQFPNQYRDLMEARFNSHPGLARRAR